HTIEQPALRAGDYPAAPALPQQPDPGAHGVDRIGRELTRVTVELVALRHGTPPLDTAQRADAKPESVQHGLAFPCCPIAAVMAGAVRLRYEGGASGEEG